MGSRSSWAHVREVQGASQADARLFVRFFDDRLREARGTFAGEYSPNSEANPALSRESNYRNADAKQ
jgi:hypothetical protein